MGCIASFRARNAIYFTRLNLALLVQMIILVELPFDVLDTTCHLKLFENQRCRCIETIYFRSISLVIFENQSQ